jgi:hypothetical protein
MHPTKQVFADNQIDKYQSHRYYKLNYNNLNPPLAMQFAVSSLRLSITLRVIHSSGQAELACPAVF